MSSKPETRYEIVDVTPELASELRARQPKIGRPRTIKRANLSKIERAIRDGGFYPESNPVKVGWPSGALLDGNHRLQAVINTGITTRMRFAWDVPDETIHGIDCGVAKSLADQLTMRGELHAKERAAICGSMGEIVTGRTFASTVDEYDRFKEVVSEELMEHAVQWQFQAKRNALPSPAFLSACFLFVTLCDQSAEAFFDRVASAVGEDSEVERQLSKRLAKIKMDRLDTGLSNRLEIMKLCCIAAEARTRGVLLDGAYRRETAAIRKASADGSRSKVTTAIKRFRQKAQAGWAKELFG